MPPSDQQADLDARRTAFRELVDAEWETLDAFIDGRIEQGSDFAAFMVAFATMAGQMTAEYAHQPPTTPLSRELLKFTNTMTEAALEFLEKAARVAATTTRERGEVH